MTHREFVEAVRKLANGRYCSARVEVVTLEARIDRPERYEIQCDAYIGGVGWTMPYPTPERALSELLSRIECEQVDSEAVDALGEVPEL